MLFLTAAEWDAFGISAEIHRFFVQLWDGLFDDLVPDTWQVRTCTTSTIIRELLDTIETASHHEPFRHDVPILAEESLRTARRDPIIGQRFHFVLRYLERLQANCSNLQTASGLCTLVQSGLASYREALISRLRELLRETGSKAKGELSALTLALATELSAAGYSTPYLRGVARAICEDPDPEFLNRLDRVLALCDGQTKEYEVVFCVTWFGAPSEALRLPGLEYARGRPAEYHSPAEREFYEQFTEQDLFVTAIVQALDPFDARAQGGLRIQNAIATYKLYLPRRQVQTKGAYALARPRGGEFLLVPPDRSRTEHLYELPAPHSHVARLLDSLSRLREPDRQSLTAALNYHHLALTAPTDDGRLVNLWIALECLARHGPGSIIDRICGTIPPVIANNRLYRLLFTTTQDILASMPRDPAHPSFQQLPRSGQRHIDRSDLLDALLDVKDGPKIEALYALIADNYLVRFRVFHLRSGPLASPRTFANDLAANIENVTWQLRRVYRARNYVIHRGSAPRNVRHLLQHLHTYLVSSLRTVVHDLESHSQWSLADALAHRKFLIHDLIGQLRGPEAHTVPKQALLRPDALHGAAGAPAAWPHDPDAEATSVVTGP